MTMFFPSPVFVLPIEKQIYVLKYENNHHNVSIVKDLNGVNKKNHMWTSLILDLQLS